MYENQWALVFIIKGFDRLGKVVPGGILLVVRIFGVTGH